MLHGTRGFLDRPGSDHETTFAGSKRRPGSGRFSHGAAARRLPAGGGTRSPAAGGVGPPLPRPVACPAHPPPRRVTRPVLAAPITPAPPFHGRRCWVAST